MKKIFLLTAASLALVACQRVDAPVSTERQVAQEQERQTTELQAQVGLPRIVNGTEKKLAKKIAEMRDNPNLLTYAYVQGLDGKLHCFGKGVGYGLPYAAQITSPTKWADPPNSYNGYQSQQVPQSEPNGLYMPADAAATWYMLIDQKTGQASPAYVEPTLTVTTFSMHGRAVSEPCD